MEFNLKQQALSKALAASYLLSGEMEDVDVAFVQTPTAETVAQMDILISALENQGVIFPDEPLH